MIISHATIIKIETIIIRVLTLIIIRTNIIYETCMKVSNKTMNEIKQIKKPTKQIKKPTKQIKKTTKQIKPKDNFNNINDNSDDNSDDEIHIDDIKYTRPNSDDKNHIDDNKDGEDVISFWRPTDKNGVFGQWYRSNFEVTKDILNNFPKELKQSKLFVNRFDVLEKLTEHKTFNTAEKFMMMGKAALFRDDITYRVMARENSPKEQKSLGQKVKKFDDTTWKTYCRDIVNIGTYLKFSQNNDCKKILLETNDKILVEGSPMDRIWGVGLKFDDPKIRDREQWRGTNYLGESLMFVRTLLK
jgi:ribA/ribD-fused uncharacterized protein